MCLNSITHHESCGHLTKRMVPCNFADYTGEHLPELCNFYREFPLVNFVTACKWCQDRLTIQNGGVVAAEDYNAPEPERMLQPAARPQNVESDDVPGNHVAPKVKKTIIERLFRIRTEQEKEFFRLCKARGKAMKKKEKEEKKANGECIVM